MAVAENISPPAGEPVIGTSAGRRGEKSATAARELPPFVTNVQEIVASRVRTMDDLVGSDDIGQLLPGKLLRTRLGSRMATPGAGCAPEGFALLCAAVELVHTASLCHDDVIDGGLVRRAAPALWKRTGHSASVLVGDLLLCKAVSLVLEAAEGECMVAFIRKAQEVCAAEAEQELVHRGKTVDEATCLRLARGKTGPLFAFVLSVCGGEDDELAAALEEAGYGVGTAYQLADDLVDVAGDDTAARKTLGTDGGRAKFTLAHASQDAVRAQVSRLCADALTRLDAWPGAREALARYLALDLQPVFDDHNIGLTTGWAK